MCKYDHTESNIDDYINLYKELGNSHLHSPIHSVTNTSTVPG